MKNTTYYHLNRPEANDAVRLADFNENVDLIDNALRQLAVGKADATGTVLTSRKINGYDLTADRSLTAADVGVSNPNLLHNWDFRNPDTIVDQRAGNYSDTTTLRYTIDRHRADYCSVVKTNGYITLSANTNLANWKMFLQMIADVRPVPGETYTLSALARTVSGPFVPVLGICMKDNGVSQSAGTYMPVSSGFQLHKISYTVPQDYADTRFSVRINLGNNAVADYSVVQLAAWKFERGSVSTLLADPPQDYGAELAKCQRYQFKNTNGASQFIRAAQLTANAIYFDIPTPVSMRASPAIVSYTTIEVRAFAGVVQTDFTFSAAVNNNGVRLTASKSGHGLTDALLNAVSVLLDANL